MKGKQRPVISLHEVTGRGERADEGLLARKSLTYEQVKGVLGQV